MANFHIENRTKTMADIQRKWDFNVSFTNISKVSPSFSSVFPAHDDTLTVLCNTVNIPATTIEEMEMLFMGTKQYFPGKKHNGGEFTCEFVETEQQPMVQAFYEWHQRMFSLDPDNDLAAGGSAFATKRQGCLTIQVKMFGYDKSPLTWSIKLYNCWIKKVDALSLAYSDGEAMKYSVGFQCDYWKLVKGDSNTDMVVNGAELGRAAVTTASE